MLIKDIAIKMGISEDTVSAALDVYKVPHEERVSRANLAMSKAVKQFIDEEHFVIHACI